ncbi:MAG: polymer-forming cytoskeletal protein [Anaerolineae bacterium]|nr:polymer-forming cytoskeletal protein [Anaerolineae bacterium]
MIGRSFVLQGGEELNGDLTVIGGGAELQADSTVRGDVTVVGGTLDLAGTVQGDVSVFGGSATLRDRAVIEGNLIVPAGAIRRAPKAVVAGEVFGGRSWLLPWPAFGGGWSRAEGGPAGTLRAFILWQVVTAGWVLGLALLGAIAVSVAPQAMGRMATQAATDPLVSFAMGLLTLVVGALLGLLLLIACCSGLLVWLAVAAAGLIGWLAVGLWVGQRLLQALKVRAASSLAEVALGVALITVLARLPWCIGFLFGLVAGSLGLGAVVLTRCGTQPPERGSVG